MATNYIQPGEIMEFTAPSGGVTAGTGVLIGKLLVIPLDTAAEDETFRGAATGVWSHAKAASQAWTEGAVVYWDDTAKVFTTAATTGNFRAGVAAAAVAGGAGDTTGIVRLNGVSTYATSAADPV
jgi:predicted RecA/RadA family phage recombinase